MHLLLAASVVWQNYLAMKKSSQFHTVQRIVVCRPCIAYGTRNLLFGRFLQLDLRFCRLCGSVTAHRSPVQAPAEELLGLPYQADGDGGGLD